MVVDTSSNRLTALSAIGHPREYFERFRHIPLDAPIPIAEVVRTGEPIYITSREEWGTRYPNLVNHTDPRTCCWVSLPMAVGDRIVGAVGLSIRYPRDFPDAERDLLQAITQHAAVAVERATLFDLERQAREEAEIARAAAEEANRVKSAFLATMSHELRTPLGAVIGYHDLLVTGVAGPLNPEQQQYLRRLRSSATHLLSLIDEVLSFARLEAARETVYTEEIVLGVLLDDVANIARPLAQARGLTFTARTPDASAVIGTDVQKARQILVNLAGNAVKYTEHGEVSMYAEVRDRMLMVAVSDTGPGIAEENIEKIFDPFWQVENSAARRAGGTGLGLSVARKLARLMGGDIDVRSVVGEGSTFTLRLPVTV
jgi:signal transduction histidine kinase